MLVAPPRARASAVSIARRGDHGRHRAPVVGRAAHVGDRRRCRRDGRAAASIAAAPPSLPMSAASASGTRRIVGERAVIAIRRVGHGAVHDRDDGRCADDGDLHLPPVLEPEVGAARARGGSRNWTATSSSSGSRVVSPGPVQRSLDQRPPAAPAGLQRRRRSEADERAARLHRGRGVHQVAADVPCARVACEPTIAQASASAVKRARTIVARGDLRVARERAERRPPSPATRRRGARRRGGSRRCCPGASTCPSGRRRRGRCRRRPGGRRRRGPRRLVDRGGCGERRRSLPASQTRSGVIGSLCTRAPITFAIAFATAPAVGTHGGSPTPFDPFGPAFGVLVSIQATSIRGASEAVTSL